MPVVMGMAACSSGRHPKTFTMNEFNYAAGSMRKTG
jgi:hypothetical protein